MTKISYSPSTGLCIVDADSEPVIINLETLKRLDAFHPFMIGSYITDWHAVSGNDIDHALSLAVADYRVGLAVRYIRIMIQGVSQEIATELLEEVEESIIAGADSQAIRSRLLIAPLKDEGELATITILALARNWGATANLLDELRAFQPNIRRLSDRWLALPETLFGAGDLSRQQLWITAVHRSVVLKLMSSRDHKGVLQTWNELAFTRSDIAFRTVVARVGRALGDILFPSVAARESPATILKPEQDSLEMEEQAPRGHIQKERALKQVEAITEAVALGEDAKAKRYLEELITSQTRFPNQEEYVVKSLCNIANQCASLFRTDFEFECLNRAREIYPNDVRVLTQLADHFKRTRDFDRALNLLEEAAKIRNDRYVKGLVADVYAEMGDSEAAFDVYEQLSKTTTDSWVRTAKADLLRHVGYLDDASREYDRIILDGLGAPRVFAGKAEVLKRQGRLPDAENEYLSLIKSTTIDEQERYIYISGLANVYVRSGKFLKAYELYDRIVTHRPFAREAVALRAAVAGSLGRAKDVISQLPQLGQSHGFAEWVNEYVRGMLLLLLDRTEDARSVLLYGASEGSLGKDKAHLAKIATTILHLRSRSDLVAADASLLSIGPLNDVFAEAVRDALALHIAIEMNDGHRIRQLRDALTPVKDEGVRALVDALLRRDWAAARQLEIKQALRLIA